MTLNPAETIILLQGSLYNMVAILLYLKYVIDHRLAETLVEILLVFWVEFSSVLVLQVIDSK